MKKTKVTRIVTEEADASFTPFDALAQQFFEGKTTVRIEGQSQEMSRSEIALHAQFKSATEGSPQSIRQFIELMSLVSQKRAAEVRAEVEWWTAFMVNQKARFARHVAEFGVEPLEFPHPDDIVIDPDKGVVFHGPLDDEQHKQLLNTQHMIEACLLQDALETRLDQNDEITGAALLAHVLNEMLPKRLQQCDVQITLRAMRLQGLPKRELLKQTRAAWRTADVSLPRGARFLSLNTVKRLTTLAYKATAITSNKYPKPVEQLGHLEREVSTQLGGRSRNNGNL